MVYMLAGLVVLCLLAAIMVWWCERDLARGRADIEKVRDEAVLRMAMNNASLNALLRDVRSHHTVRFDV